MRFSVVTISYNQAKFLRRAIASVLNQSGVDLEYIVVDPGSSDDSRAIIDSYGDRIGHRVYEPDQGDRKSTRLNSSPNAHLVCRLLLEKTKRKTSKNNGDY